MRCFSDTIVLFAPLTSGFFFGYYLKFVYAYDNLFIHRYAIAGAVSAILLAIVWTSLKYRKKRYVYDHFPIMGYGCLSLVICSCFMINDALDTSFYFGFIGHACLIVAPYSFISLRSSAKGSRPTRIAMANACYFKGLTAGYTMFNEFEAQTSGWILLGLVLTLTIAGIVNEVLLITGVHDYKQSPDLAFNVLNDEKLVFLSVRSIRAQYSGRVEFYFTRNIQWIVVALSSLVVVERIYLFSATVLQLSWTSTAAFTDLSRFLSPFIFYTIGCTFGSLLMMRYKPKMVYLLFGLIKITATGALLGVYDEEVPESCFIYLCFYYIAMGVYSSVALQMLVECLPFLFTECGLAVAVVIELCAVEALQYESKIEDSWMAMLYAGICTILLTVFGIIVTQIFLPNSRGLVDIRNQLIGLGRQCPTVPQSILFNGHQSYFIKNHMQMNEMSEVKFDGNRIFKQYPAQVEESGRY